MNHFISIHDCESPLSTIIGPKAANLIRLAKSGVSVPSGFIIPHNYLSKYSIDKVSKNNAEFEVISKQRIANNTALIELFRSEISNALIIHNFTIDTKLIVRSSSLIEDSSKATFAGLFLSLTSRGVVNELCDKILKVYESRSSSQAIKYGKILVKKNIVNNEIQPMSIIVQKVIASKFGGVTFILDKKSLNKTVTEIHTLGPEKIVKGAKPTLTGSFDDNNQFQINEKISGNEKIKLSDEIKKFSPCFSDTLKSIQNEFKCEVDLEWIWDGVDLWILQVRPVIIY